MELCKKCLFYSAKYDEARAVFDDTTDKERHYCPMYEPIPAEIENDRQPCPMYEPAEDYKGA